MKKYLEELEDLQEEYKACKNKGDIKKLCIKLKKKRLH